MPIVEVSDKEKIKLIKVINNQKPITCENHPYKDFQCDFSHSKIATLYKAYANFQKSYYNRENPIANTPMLSRWDFKNRAPIIVVDMSRQNDSIKTSTVDLRIKFDVDEAFPATTSAYCLILHDQIITYNPFNGDVRTLQ